MSCAKAAIPAVAVSGAVIVPIVIGAAALAVAAVIAVKAYQSEREERELAAYRQAREAARAEREETVRRWGESNARLREAATAFSSLQSAWGAIEEGALGEKRQARVAAVRPADGAVRDQGPQGPSAAENARAMLEQAERFLQELPEAFKSDRTWPYERFVSQVRRFHERFREGRHPDPQELGVFLQTLSGTAGRFIDRSEAVARSRVELFRLADELLGEVLLARSEAVRPETQAQLDQLAGVLGSADPAVLTRESVGEAKTRLAELKAAVQADVHWLAFRQTLADSLTRHLEEMGYRSLAGFGLPEVGQSDEALFAVPGGERLRAVIGADGRMDFRLAHERREAGSPLTDAEIAWFRRQEDRWSRDFRDLMRRLTKEGFSYQVQAESLAAEDAIPIVVVETAQEILDEEAERERLGEETLTRNR